MKILKSYTGAMVVLAVVIVVSTLFGSHRSLTEQRRQVEALFYGTKEQAGSIAGDLQDCLDITANLLSVGRKYLPQEGLAALEGSRNMLADWHGISSGYTAYIRLQDEAAAVLDQLEGCPLTEKDRRYVQGFRTDLASEADTISRDGYHEAVEDFNRRVLGRFPASLLGRITFVSPAEHFGQGEIG